MEKIASKYFLEYQNLVSKKIENSSDPQKVPPTAPPHNPPEFLPC
jgi:hypothetical protein